MNGPAMPGQTETPMPNKTADSSSDINGPIVPTDNQSTTAAASDREPPPPPPSSSRGRNWRAAHHKKTAQKIADGG